ncbi:MAG: hypothetical protein KJO66_08415, partial [Gammaproteobacteria bacterium]|nr:hypothetical protein [Gammaproteobacteria bacterium]
YQHLRRSLGIWSSSQLHPVLQIPFREFLQSRDPDPLVDPKLDFDTALCRDIAPGGQLGEWVWHNDRNAMMASVENRSPLLDFRLHPFVFSGYDRKYHRQWNKYELRRAFDAFQPLPTQWRSQKQGFRWDGRQFINNNRRQILELIEASECMSELLDTRKLVALAHKMPKLLRTSVGKQALCLAGIEATLMKG